MMIPPSSNTSSPSQPPLVQHHHRKTDICETCGDKGYLKQLIYCAQCLVSAEHSYCMRELPKEEDGIVNWTCEECSLNDAKCRSTPLRRSARIREAAKAKRNLMKIERKNREEAYLGEACEIESFVENQYLPIKKRRRLDSEDEKCRSTPLRSKIETENHEAIKAKCNKIERENHEDAYLGTSCKAESSDENQYMPIKKRRHLYSVDENVINEECDTKTVNSETVEEPYLES